MISKYDIQKLQDLPIEEVANLLQIAVSHHKALCPFHADSRPSLTFNRNKNKYRCYVCDARGGTIDLVMHTQGWTFQDSCHWLANQFGIIISDDDLAGSQYLSNRGRRPRVEPASKVPAWKAVPEEKPDLPYLERLMAQPILNEQAKKFLFEDRKLSRKVIEQLGISSISYNCPMSSSPKPTYFDGPALLIPYRDIDGNLLSVQSRYLGDSRRGAEDAEKLMNNSCSEKNLLNSASLREIPRFRFPKGSTCHIFNLDCLKNLSSDEPIFITEGVTDCLAMLSAGFKAIAIPSATLLRKEDIELLNVKPLNFHMYPDADEPGERLFEQLKDLLPQLVRHSLPAGFKDVGQYYAFIHKND